jgi:AcrR family transcriptional regulator
MAGDHEETIAVPPRLLVHLGRHLEPLQAVRVLTLAQHDDVLARERAVRAANLLVDLPQERSALPDDVDRDPSPRRGRVSLPQRQTCLSFDTLTFMATALAASGRPARERILETAYDLFARRGVRDVGVDEIIERSGVAKATLYRHFPSKDALVLAFLERREELWTHGFVEAGARARGKTPEEQLLAIFDVFDGWFRKKDFEACSFINVLVELGPRDEVGKASIDHLENIRGVVSSLAEEAGLREVESFARSWHILMKGSIIAAAEGDAEAAHRAQSMARRLIDAYR